MDLLKRSRSPITEAAWHEIDDAARKALRTRLAGRRFADVAGPKGWDFAAVGLGRLNVPDRQTVEGVGYGIHRVQPLIEVRARFELDVWELDNAERGARDLDLDPLLQAVGRAAQFEDTAIFRGFEPGGIAGLDGVVEGEPRPLRLEARPFLDALSAGVLDLTRASVEGPYALVLGTRPFRFLASCETGYPLMRQVKSLIEGPVLESDIVEGGYLVSTRGGDFELTIGQDFSIGYETHDARHVRLYVAESFTFRVLDPTAVLRLAAPQ